MDHSQSTMALFSTGTVILAALGLCASVRAKPFKLLHLSLAAPRGNMWRWAVIAYLHVTQTFDSRAYASFANLFSYCLP